MRALVYLRSKHPDTDRIAQGLGYFRGNRHRMRYADAKAQGLPIGSGVVEAACKTQVTERLKRSGMRRGVRGGQAILRYRLVQADFHLPLHREPNGTIIGGSPRVGIWLWPDNRSPGELEDFVEAMIPRDDGVWPLAQAYVDGIPEAEPRFPAGKTLKTQLHAWLATHRTPGRMSSAIGTGDLEVDGPVAERFADWLRRLFSSPDFRNS